MRAVTQPSELGNRPGRAVRQSSGKGAMMDPPIIYTVGHSTRSLDDLTGLLEAAYVHELVDVRSVPRSRRHPQFGECERQKLATPHLRKGRVAALADFVVRRARSRVRASLITP
jgi:hypothetical protein